MSLAFGLRRYSGNRQSNESRQVMQAVSVADSCVTDNLFFTRDSSRGFLVEFALDLFGRLFVETSESLQPV